MTFFQNGNTTHGLSHKRIYRIWDAMHRRCYDKKHMVFHKYGGRGIKVCNRWHNVLNFLKDMGNPAEDQSLDRIDNDGNYSPENCRWADRYTQARNRSNNCMITYDGRTMTVADWADVLGIPRSTLYSRLYRLNWSVHRALTTK